STQAVTTGAYRAVEFIKANIKLEGVTKASVTDSKKVVEICTQYAQKGMFNIFLTIFFATLAFAFVEPYFFVGYLISIALFGLYLAGVFFLLSLVFVWRSFYAMRIRGGARAGAAAGAGGPVGAVARGK